METKHTPGPWGNIGKQDVYTFNIYADTSKGRILVAETFPNWSHENKVASNKRIEEAESNAKLIAAAPELLEALKSLYEFAELYGVGSYPKASHEDWSGYLESAQNAIKKATE